MTNFSCKRAVPCDYADLLWQVVFRAPQLRVETAICRCHPERMWSGQFLIDTVFTGTDRAL